MSNKGVVHIFIGAPPILPSLPWSSDTRCLDGQRTEWEEIAYVNTNYGLELKNANSTKIPVDRERLGASPYGKSLSDRPSLFTFRRKGNLVQKADNCVTGIISGLVSSTENCHITSSCHRGTGGTSDDVHDYLDVSNPKIEDDGVKTCTNLGISTQTEFSSVLTSSQLAVQGHVHIFGQNVTAKNNEISVSPYRQCKLEVSPKNAVKESTTPESAHQDVIYACSFELFTQILDHESNTQESTSQQYKHFQIDLKDLEKSTKASICELNNNSVKFDNKRKKKITSSSSSKNEQKSKKTKKSSSPVTCLKKRPDNINKEMLVKVLTLLKCCSEKNKQYNILVAVVHPCYVKEIQVKSGPNAGSSFPLATIIVLDQSDAEHKVLLWRSAAFWSLALSPGDIIILTNMTVSEDRWNEKAFLQSTFRSHLINLGNYSTVLPEQSSHIVEHTVLQELMEYVRNKHYCLRELPPRPPQKLDCVQYMRLAQLQPELLVHSILKVSSISILKECTYNFKGLQQNKIILTIEERKGQTGTLILWGASISWCDQIRRKRDHIWVFKYIFSQKNILSGDMELHTTPWSSCECLFDDDIRAIGFQKKYLENVSPTNKISLRAITESRYSGEIQVQASISELEFRIPDAKNILMTQTTCVTDILISLSAIIYSGCGKCKMELKMDENHVYEQCFSCLPFNQVKTFYRPALMTIMSEDCAVCVHIPSDILEKIFLNIAPNLLNKTVANFTDVTYGDLVADLCHSLLAETGESYFFLIRSLFLLDENSIPLEQEFHALDFHLDI